MRACVRLDTQNTSSFLETLFSSFWQQTSWFCVHGSTLESWRTSSIESSKARIFWRSRRLTHELLVKDVGLWAWPLASLDVQEEHELVVFDKPWANERYVKSDEKMECTWIFLCKSALNNGPSFSTAVTKPLRVWLVCYPASSGKSLDLWCAVYP